MSMDRKVRIKDGTSVYTAISVRNTVLSPDKYGADIGDG